MYYTLILLSCLIENNLFSHLLWVNIESRRMWMKEVNDHLQKSLFEVQQEVDRYISQFKEGYFSPLSMLARMSEEVGELAREVNHQFGEKPKKSTEADNSIELELGDILFITI